jgi:CRISPR-associated protein Csb2
MQLNLTVTFADTRYHGHVSEDELEFPPSPSRLYQALIAGSHCGAYNLIHTEKRDRALQWLESLDPPTIEAPSVGETGSGLTNYVPNNDNQMPMTNKPGSGHVRTAKPLLGNIFPTSSTLVYRWQFDVGEEANANATVVCSMARLITHLGQHQDTVYAKGEITTESTDSANSDLLRPIETPDGDRTSPTSGALDAYRQRYQKWLRGESRDDIIVPLRQVSYPRPGTIRFNAPMALFELRSKDDERFLRYDPRRLREPAGMVRHAMLEWLDAHPAFHDYYGAEMTSQLVSGHESNDRNGARFNGPHIACVPIPSLNERELADGWIRRVLLLGLGCETAKATELFDSIANGMNGSPLQDNSSEVGYLKKVTLKDQVLRQYIIKDRRVWRSVTPIILTGYMRRGRGAEVLIARALKQAGVNENDIESIAVFSGPIVPKTVHALDYRVEKGSYLAETPRYHAEVIFKRPAVGAFVVGRGRHVGFGLMLPCL